MPGELIQDPLCDNSSSPPNNSKRVPGLAPYIFDQSDPNYPPLDQTILSKIHPHNSHASAEQSQAPQSPKTSWSQLFNSNRVKTNGTILEFIPSHHVEPGTTPSVLITPEEVSEELSRWRNAIVGYVIGARPPYKLMKQFVERRWKAFGAIELFILKPGIFVFNFPDEDTKQQVMEMGPWSYYDKPLILKPWSSSHSYDRSSPDKLPIWVRLPHLKLHLWSAKTLSKIASQIGQPLFTDWMTALRQRLAYARICVEIDCNSTFPQTIEIVDHDGSLSQQQVEYEWIPTKCETCKLIGHKSTQCPKIIKQEWRQIPKSQEGSSRKFIKEEPVQVEMDDMVAAVCPQVSPKEVITSNKFNCLTESTEKDPLPSAIKALAPVPPMLQDKASHQSQATGNVAHMVKEKHQIAVEYQVEDQNDELNSPASRMEIAVDSHKEDSINYEADNWEVKLSKSQRKKRGKILHALTQKEKILEVKFPARQSSK